MMFTEIKKLARG